MPSDWTLVTRDALDALDLEGLLAHVEFRRCFDFSLALANLRNQPAPWLPSEAACVEFAVQVTGMMLRLDQRAKQADVEVPPLGLPSESGTR